MQTFLRGLSNAITDMKTIQMGGIGIDECSMLLVDASRCGMEAGSFVGVLVLLLEKYGIVL